MVSGAQHAARQRNWKIRRLRALNALGRGMLDYLGSVQLQEAVDRELITLGAETETVRKERIDREMDEWCRNG